MRTGILLVIKSYEVYNDSGEMLTVKFPG